MRHVLDEVLATFDPLSGWQDGVKDVLVAWLALHWWELVSLGSYSFKIRKTFKFVEN